MSPSASPLGITPRLTARLSGRFRRLGYISPAYCHDNQYSWNRFLPWSEYAQNSLKQTIPFPQASAHSSAYSATILFPWTEEPSDIPAVDHWFRASKIVWYSAHVHLQQAVWRHETYADACRSSTPIYRPGDKVWLSTRDLRLRLPCQKLSHRYISPFTIERQINEVTFRLQLPAQYCIHPLFHVSLLKPVSPSVTKPDEPAVPPPPEIIKEPLVYRVQDILDSRWRSGHLEYLID